MTKSPSDDWLTQQSIDSLRLLLQDLMDLKNRVEKELEWRYDLEDFHNAPCEDCPEEVQAHYDAASWLAELEAKGEL